MSATESRPRLKVGQALGDGWRAFQRAPWLFVGFFLALTALQLLLQGIQAGLQVLLPPIDTGTLPSFPPAGAPLGLGLASLPSRALIYGVIFLTLIAGLVINIWGTCGMVRAAWVALGGGRPRLSTFVRFDPRVLWRLYFPGLLLRCAVIFAVVVVVVLTAVLGMVNPLLALPTLLLLFAGFLYVAVSQTFLPQVALLHDTNPFDVLARGREVVDPVWLDVLLLGLLNAALLIAGLLACLIGLVVAAPVSICMVTAAYRQLFGPEDRTGLLRTLPAAGS
ncbi:MAG: hypothetical protein ACK5QW_09745 [Cyanobacteriota bacterium]